MKWGEIYNFSYETLLENMNDILMAFCFPSIRKNDYQELQDMLYLCYIAVSQPM